MFLIVEMDTILLSRLVLVSGDYQYRLNFVFRVLMTVRLVLIEILV